METIIIATNNQGKIREIREILKNYKLLTMEEAQIEIQVEEDQETFLRKCDKKSNTNMQSNR